MNNTEKKIEELENRIKELETITSAITYTMGLILEAIQNNASLIGQLTTIIEENIN